MVSLVAEEEEKGKGESVLSPCGLSKVWALSWGLEVRPLDQLVFLREGRIRKFMVFVIGVDQVLDNRAGLPKGEPRVGVDDSYRDCSDKLGERSSAGEEA